MASLAISDISTALKERYPDGLPEKMIYKSSPFMAAIRKDRDKLLAGRSAHIPLKYTHPQGASATFATGRTNMKGSKFKGFDVTPSNYFGFAQIDNEVIARARAKGDGSFIEEFGDEVEGGIYTVGRQMTRGLFGNGGGSIGKISAASNPATPTITLDNPSDIRWFEIGQVLEVSADDGTGGGGIRVGSVEVSKVDRDAGTVTATGNWTAGIAAAVAGDFIFRGGDYAGMMKGYEAWIPRTTPAATAFFGVDRTPDSRLYGTHTDLSGFPIEEAMKRACERLIRENSEVDFAVLSSVNYLEFELAMAGRVVPTTVKSYEDDGLVFDAVKVGLAGRRVTVMMDPDAPVDRLLMGQLDTWTLGSLGKSLVDFNDADGNQVLRTVTTDAVEAQLVSRAQLWCTAPGWNGNFAI